MDADLVILCVPVGVMGPVAAEIAADLPADAIISDVGSCKAGILAALQEALPGRTIIPAHPVAGTENSGPEADRKRDVVGRSVAVRVNLGGRRFIKKKKNKYKN